MPKIEVNEKMFFSLLGERCACDELERRLVCAKAELDEASDPAQDEDYRSIKIELNDTNRPDLWSTAGLARQLRLYGGGARRDYEKSDFFSGPQKNADYAHRTVIVDPRLRDIRPFMTAFVISGKPIDEPMLLDIIQTQEKLCANYGRKRKMISMGVYREAEIAWPIHYAAVDPDAARFVPLQGDREATCREILAEHPKGREYGHIISGFSKFPLLTDDNGRVMSMAPIINSADLGAVKTGDSNLLVEMTGTETIPLLLATNIVACDFFDAGYNILPVKIIHPYDTGVGKEIITPYYFQEPTSVSLAEMNKLLGADLSADEAVRALERMGSAARADEKNGGTVISVSPPAYRDDFLHAVDIIEDALIGRGVETFEPLPPTDFTVGRLTPETLLSRRVKTLFVGLGYQEMVFNYLGGERDYIERMNISAERVIEIANPMTENYRFVRPSILPSLLNAESVSANAAYPHKIFETGKVAYLCGEENYGCRTRQHLGFLIASADANFNEAASHVAALLYQLGFEYKVEESFEPEFIPGRQAAVFANGKRAGVFGEIHPQVLENWTVAVPCAAGEIDVSALLLGNNL